MRLFPSSALPLAALGAVSLTGCLFSGESKSKGVKVKPEILRVAGPGVRAKAAAQENLRAAPHGSVPLSAAPFWSSALSITTFKVPIRRISLHNAAFTQAADIYSCVGDDVECQVEAAGKAFQNELDAAPIAVPPGEYRYVFVKACAEGGTEATASLTATVTLDGKEWHTHPTAILDTAGSERPLFIKSKSCARTYALPRPLRISDSLGEQVSFKLYFDLEELAYAALGSRQTAKAWTPDNCAGSRPAETGAPGAPFVCIGYPELSGLIDASPVTLERYRINGGATLGLFFTGGTGLPVGGYTRRYYREGATLDPGFQAVLPLRDLGFNADGTLSLAAFGGGTTGNQGSEFQVASFRRETHSGSFTGMPDSLGNPATGSYSAVRLPP